MKIAIRLKQDEFRVSKMLSVRVSCSDSYRNQDVSKTKYFAHFDTIFLRKTTQCDKIF